MIASVNEPLALLRFLTLLLAAGLATACAGPTPLPLTSPLDPLPLVSVYMPDDADYAARDVAAASLISDAAAIGAGIQRISQIDAERRERQETATGLLPYAIDAYDAILDDERARRRASQALLKRDDLDKALRTRLEQEVNDDPLELAGERIHDHRVRRFGRMANAFFEPIGRSAFNTALLPLRLAQAVMGILVTEHMADDLTAPERQALAHWKEFVDRHPDAPEAAPLLARIEEAQLRWFQTRRDQSVKDAREALDSGDALMAIAYSERALRYAPEDPEAQRLRSEAESRGQDWNESRRLSLQPADSATLDLSASRDLAVALMLPDGDIEARALELLERDPGPLHDEARFALSIAAADERSETDEWDTLEDLAKTPDSESNMARHARAIYTDPFQNPYRAFELTSDQVIEEKLRWLFFGPLAHGARDRHLPRPVEWIIDLPAVFGAAAGFGNRLIRFPFMPSDYKVPSAMARRYLERFPDGAHEDEVRDWLVDFEKDRGNYVGALRFAESDELPDPLEIADLREDASEQALEASKNEVRRDVRLQLLRDTARKFPETEAGHEAGILARESAETASPQRIRISRGYLLENPVVAGPEALALRPELLDDELDNGELHPDGITLLGGRVIEFAFIDEEGRKRAPPERTRQVVSKERLARVVAHLEETNLHTLKTDRDARVEYDADRDRFFERALLGLTDEIDPRPEAESTYSFLGMRERYGLVRSRESILPVALVLQGSFEDMSLGAFPRIRMPKPTADAFLYR